MDFNLRCNTLKCRKPLTERAVVTTCSHIFCIDCANTLKLASANLQDRHCPACKESLSNPDDAVNTVLTPTEDYKTSVLSGLDPNTIMECAGRALAFWTYQTTQEIFYQQFLGKNLTEKYSLLNSQMDRIVKDANAEIENCQKKIEELQFGTKTLQEERNDLVKQFQAKASRHAQTQKMYENLKNKVRMSGIPAAALQSADMIAQSRPVTYNVNAPMDDAGGIKYTPNTSFSYPTQNGQANDLGHAERHYRTASGSGSVHSTDFGTMPPPQRPVHGKHSNTGIISTPQHRSQLPGSLRTAANRSHIPQSTAHFQPPGTGTGRRSNPSYSNHRQNQNASSYGISAGMKVGSAPGTSVGTSDLTNPRFTANSLANSLANGLGGAFATGPAFPGNHFS